MPEIILTTIINAPIERCFDLARSIDLHMSTSARTNEKAIAGVTKGLIGKGERVTWRAKHFGIYQELTSEITQFELPFLFEDSMITGAFKSIRHKHIFEFVKEKTIMKDVFEFESPLGIIGKCFNTLILTAYMTRFLKARNNMIKDVAESDGWKTYLTGN